MSRTVFALATAPGRAAVAIIRISGPAAREALAALHARPPPARLAALRTLRGQDGEILDRALVLWFPAPSSYTGEDSAELHLHGGAAVVEQVSEALLAAGVQLAEPGQFTRRAFENGKLDLDQAEAVADLIDAESAAQARQAMGQLRGALGERYRRWRGALIDALAGLEACVDFPDEDVPSDAAARAAEPILSLLAQLDMALADQARGRRVRDGYTIAIVGAPNAGKSSILNGLVGRDAAIVTDIPGTTRDVIEVPLVLGAYRTLLADTAGIRDHAGIVEAEGVRRAQAWAAAADLRLWVVDQSASGGPWRQAASLIRAGDICVLSKSDLPTGGDASLARALAKAEGLEALSHSAVSTGRDRLRTTIAQRVAADLSGADFPAVTRARHETHLREARTHLARAIADWASPELAAENVRLAARALSKIAGQIGVEDILGQVFAGFCIGK
ncbi:MAG TPA: tRNA uridine-5-carboxymethylaminomethyl(34) synthesis GTPase MnmE [Caulobacteraceae bacterium]